MLKFPSVTNIIYFIFVGGARGCGKSVSLLSLSYWARNMGWLVVYIPSAKAYALDNTVIVPDENGMFEQQDLIVQWLRSVRNGHIDVLKTIPLAEPLPSSLETVCGEVSNLYELVDFGARHRTSSAAVLQSFLQCLQSQTVTPALVVVDEWNAWTGLTEVRNLEGKPVNADQLSFAAAFKNASLKPFKRGAFVTADSFTLSKRLHQVPLASILLSAYTPGELKSVLSFYKSSGWSSIDDVSALMPVAQKMTSANPREVYRWASIL